MILYSTHSHYLIEPRWLEGAFIVFNDAVDYERDLAKEADNRPIDTNIHVQRYRDFVGQHPDKLTYFQPILDKLDYVPGKLDFVDHMVFVEGKIDFYILEYFRVQLGDKQKFRFMPSSGANDLGPLISLYLGWGRNFLVLLDDDKAGRNAKDRYKSDWFLTDASVSTLGDMSEKLKGKKIEGLIAPAGLDIIKKEIGKASASKKDIARFFQERHALNNFKEFDSETKKTMRMFLDEIGKRFP